MAPRRRWRAPRDMILDDDYQYLIMRLMNVYIVYTTVMSQLSMTQSTALLWLLLADLPCMACNKVTKQFGALSWFFESDGVTTSLEDLEFRGFH